MLLGDDVVELGPGLESSGHHRLQNLRGEGKKRHWAVTLDLVLRLVLLQNGDNNCSSPTAGNPALSPAAVEDVEQAESDGGG